MKSILPYPAMDTEILKKRYMQLYELIQSLSIYHDATKVYESIKKGKSYYYIKENNITKYLPKDDSLSTYLQGDYNRKLYEKAIQEFLLLKQFLSNYNPTSLENLYAELSQESQKYIKPQLLTNEEYAASWVNLPYKSAERCETAFTTIRGDHVKSKSEVIIADTLYEMGIPYRYEQELLLEGTNPVYPDFTLLNVYTRKEYYYEHFGMMDNPDYCRNCLKKLIRYSCNGYNMGDNLIATFESQKVAFNRTALINTIKANMYHI